MTRYAIYFDFPPSDGGPVYAGLHGDPPALGWAPTLATARIFHTEEQAAQTLEHGYGEYARLHGSVVPVKDDAA